MRAGSFFRGVSFLNTCQTIQFSVSEIQQDICRYHGKVQEIEKQHIPFVGKGCHIGFICKFGSDAGDIAQKDQTQEGEAFPLCGSDFIGLDHVHGPGSAKAEDHGDF